MKAAVALGDQTKAQRQAGRFLLLSDAMERLFCWECLEVADERAAGWRAYRCDVPGEDPEPILRVYCPGCSAREFGPLAGSGETAESAS